MDADDLTIEEGEIVDDECDNNYIPLPRPANYATTIPLNRFPIVQESESEDELSASESDSDSDSKTSKAKKPKVQLKPKLKASTNAKQKKYDIWSTRVQEDVLAETLNSCDVTFKDRSRDVESYDYTLSYSHTRIEKSNNKRSRDDRKNTNLSLVKRHSNEKEEQKGSARSILDLAVTAENTVEEIGRDLANKLCEEKEDLLIKIVDVAGKDKAFEVFKETKRIEEEGGMLIMNQTRRRTPGGVFLFLLRHDSDLTQEQLSKIFDENRLKYKEELKQKKKNKIRALKQKVALAKSNKNLPDLLTKAELCMKKIAEENDRTRKDSSHVDVINPPPTPETDCHENSGDGMDNNEEENVVNHTDSLSGRKLENYDIDYLDLGSGNTMDLF